MFAELSDDDCDAVLRVLKGRRGGPGDVLFREGDPGDTLLIVVDGQLEATVTTPGGTQAKLYVIQPGHVVGELAFLDAAPRSATVSTPTGATVLEFSRRALLLLCRDQPRIGAIVQRNILSDLSRRVRDVEGATSAGPASARHPPPAPENPRAKGRSVTTAQLRAYAVLASHSAEDLDLLAYASNLRAFARGEVLMREGAAGDAAYLLLSGSVDVSRSGEDGPRATLAPGALVGQLALLDRAPRLATVTATTDTVALEIRGEVFVNLVQASSPLALRFQREVATAAARHLRGMNARFAATAVSNDSSWHEVDADFATGADEPIELDIDPSVLRH